MPVFTRMDIDKGDECFEVRLEAECRREALAYDWSATIKGTADGTIAFEVEGVPGMTFPTPRIGMCVLYGIEALAGHSFALTRSDGSTVHDEFPVLVKPALVADYHQSLAFRTNEGIDMTVTSSQAGMRIEDQRNFGDNSYKMFTDNQHGEDQAKEGLRAGNTLTLAVTVRDQALLAAARRWAPAVPIPIVFDHAVGGVKIPSIEIGSDTPYTDFSAPNRNRPDFESLQKVVFGIRPGAHLYDNDTYMENTGAIVSEVETLRSFSSCKQIRIDPVTLKPPYDTAEIKLEGGPAFIAAWCARMLKYLSMAEVDETAFDVEEPQAINVLKALSAHAGKSILLSEIGPHEAVDAFCVTDGDTHEVWVINKTRDEQQVAVTVPDAWNRAPLPAGGEMTLAPFAIVVA